MKKLLSITIILGFLLVDFLFFHDFFKKGDIITFPQYLTGILSVPILIISGLNLLKK